MVDVHRQINEVTRALDLDIHDGGRRAVLTARQTYDTDISDLWDAITSAERIPRWFMPISGDLRVGGRYQLEGNAGGEVRECEPPHRLSVTWEYGEEFTLLDVRLSETSPGRTKLELVHTADVDEARWNEFGPGAVGMGWDLTLMALSEHVSADGIVDPTNAAEWTASAEGTTFMTMSGELWRDADIAAGTDTTSATEAANRCIAAYTATPEG